MCGKVMSRSSSGSTKAKNTMVATPAAKKLGQRIAPTRCTIGRGGWSNSGGVAGPGMRLLYRLRRRVGQRPDPGGDQARTGRTEQFPVRGHAAVAAFGDRLAQRLAAVAVQPVIVGQVRRAQLLVALAVDPMAGHAHAVVELLALRGHEVVAGQRRVVQGT